MDSTLSLEWKQEPASPLGSEESQVSDDAALYETSGHSDPKLELEYASCDSKAELASKLLEDLEQLEDFDDLIKNDFDGWIEGEPFSTWFEEKMLPVFDDAEMARGSFVVPPKTEQATTVPDTQSLLQEFETVFGAVELTNGTLTPPQSPQYKPLLTVLEPATVQSLDNEILPYSQTPIPLSVDVAHELAVVDELIRTRTEDLVQYPSSPGSNSSSGSSNFGDCSSDDPEWIPETIDASSDRQSVTKAGTGRRRCKPYTRAPEDKKSRKKEQNKNAATRYRMKKKAEIEVILEDERLLSEKNEGFERQIIDLRREIKYLKGLMRDVFKAKGLLN